MTITRRTFASGLAALSAVTLASVGPGRAQTPSRIARIGILSISGIADRTGRWTEFVAQLRLLGHVEGHDIAFERRFLEGRAEQADKAAAELVRTEPRVIVVTGGRELEAVRRASATIPIVTILVPDPIAMGVVKSFARPGGTVTGLTSIDYTLYGKRLEILHQAVPSLRKVAVLLNSTNPRHAPSESWRPALIQTGRSLGTEVEFFPVAELKHLGAVFATASASGTGVIVALDGGFSARSDELGALTLAHKTPTMFGLPHHVEAGGLLSYAADPKELWGRAAVFVDKILRGADPAEIPIEQPTKFQLAVNMRTARALGLAAVAGRHR